MVPNSSLLRKSAFASVLALSVGLTACSSSSNDDSDTDDDADPGTDTPMVDNTVTVQVTLDVASTEPPAMGADGAMGTGEFTVDTETGAVSGMVTVSGTTGRPDMAHIHQGAVGVPGGVLIALEGNADGTVWTVPAGQAFDTPGIAAFEAGETYINVHTEANPRGELRGQLVPPVTDPDAPGGTYTITFTNTSATQPMTPPVVALHNAPDAAENGVRLFEVGAAAEPEVVGVAENGDVETLATLVGSLVGTSVSAFGVAVVDPAAPGPVLPGETSELELTTNAADQVLSLVSMVVCTNDAFSGVDSMALEDGTFTAPIYDAGSEVNTLELNYWVGLCSPDGMSDNLHQDEGGTVQPHPGQQGSENADFDFAADTGLLQVTITKN